MQEFSMSNTKDSFFDVTLPIIKEDASRTSKLNAENLVSPDLATRKLFDAKQEKTIFQIALALAGHAEPIVVRNTATITLGRADRQRNAIPTIDLSDDNALLLGVSRLHAKILYMDGNFYIKDMGSINGTWLNNLRLEPHQLVPLERGDNIRLGRLTMNVI
jgi:hypothetical protein